MKIHRKKNLSFSPNFKSLNYFYLGIILEYSYLFQYENVFALNF